MGRFRHKSTLVVLYVLLCVFAATAQEPVFRASTNLVRLIVSVKDAKGQAIGSLEKADFKVTDSGVAQSVSVFEHHTEVPLSVSLLLDTSGSTGKDLAYEVSSLKKFIRALLKEGNPLDAIALYAFDSDVTELASFTRREQRLYDSLDRIRPDGGTSLFDAVYLASRRIESRDGRHVIVVVTDGGDTTSRETFQSTLRTVQLSETIVYPILVTPITTDPGRNLGGERVLAQFADYTGGRVFEPASSKELDRIFTEILRDLRTQYMLGYYPANLPAELPSFHPIRVTLSRPELKVSTRSGYYEDAKQR
jgi:Ca-activated chloride channel family protein